MNGVGGGLEMEMGKLHGVNDSQPMVWSPLATRHFSLTQLAQWIMNSVGKKWKLFFFFIFPRPTLSLDRFLFCGLQKELCAECS